VHIRIAARPPADRGTLRRLYQSRS
jgi:hypothetical protein